MTESPRDVKLKLLSASLLALTLAACGGSAPPPAETTPETETQTPPPPTGEAGEVDRAAELAAKEEELAQREAEIALKEKEAELARREAELAAKEKAAAKKPATTKPATSTTGTPPKVTPPPPPPPAPAIVPAGTQLSIELVSSLSTKTAQVGDPVDARLTSPVEVDGKVVIPAGATVQGSVTRVVSGSKQVGGTAALGVNFTALNRDPDTRLPISGKLVQKGVKESGKDAAKIAGGAVLGAIVGKQIEGDKGAVIGGVLGAGAGAAVAKGTGNEVEIPAGTIVGFVLDTPVEVPPK